MIFVTRPPFPRQDRDDRNILCFLEEIPTETQPNPHLEHTRQIPRFSFAKNDRNSAFRNFETPMLLLVLCLIVHSSNGQLLTEPTTTVTTTTTTIAPTTTVFTTTPSSTNGTSNRPVIIVGLLFVEGIRDLQYVIGYESSAGALLVAEDRIRAEHLLDGYDFQYVVDFDNCIEAQAVGLSVDLITKQNVNIIIGPTCNAPAIASAVLASYYDTPIFTWGLTTSSDLANVDRFPSTIILVPNWFHLSIAMLSTFHELGWHEFAFIYSTLFDEDQCPYFKSDLQDAVTEYGNTVITNYMAELKDFSNASIQLLFSEINQRARIVVVCAAAGYGLQRKLMLAASDAGMTTEDWVWVFPSISSQTYDTTSLSTGASTKIWTSNPPDGRDDAARDAFTRTIILTEATAQGTDYAAFGKEVIAKMALPPFNCQTCSNQTVSTGAGHLHDAFYIYANAMNKSLSQNEDALNNGTALLINAAGTYQGINGNITVASNGGVQPKFVLAALTPSYDTGIFWQIELINGIIPNITKFNPSIRQIFAFYSDAPDDTPTCGFNGKNCSTNIFLEYLGWFIAGIIAIIVTICCAILGVIMAIRARLEEKRRLNSLWRVPYVELSEIRQGGSKAETQSMISLQSDKSGSRSEWSNKLSIESKLSVHGNHVFFFYQKEPILAIPHESLVRFDEEDAHEFRYMRNIEQDNLNRFIGLSIDGPKIYSLWRFCHRGSLTDTITRGSMPLDGFFIYSLLLDLVNGLFYIHNSFLKCHGQLTSRNCLIDDRWQLKISQYGLSSLRSANTKREELLWTAPEHLRDFSVIGSQPGDIYSMSIIAAELVGKTSPWNLENRTESAEEVVHMVSKGLAPPMRPHLFPPEGVELSQSMLLLIRDCWDEIPGKRPDINIVRTMLRNMHNGKQKNLMDHVLQTLEEHAESLEREVEGRTKELIDEKKKSDLLLYRMLPKQVADRLKLGQPIDPEGFDSVSIFFSDVVGFTSIASRCTPLQVVNLLNGLYTIFDGIIEKHDAYKVETIGDGYLCVSGLPHRNGKRHIKEICDMSLELNNELRGFRVHHLPDVIVQIRVGVHTGPCVAGVVGLTMPRYCLFGDAVNTASRMESNGKPAMIHLSPEAKQAVVDYGGYVTESRGEVIIKGKGVMETFWLIGKIGEPPEDRWAEPPRPPPPQTHTLSPPPAISSLQSSSMYVDYLNST
ncbi:unnamed protein product, partial [Mesorhabditis belari]|uniref:Guanylate cyclase n=1 Tax=Mesorhabditis belari TaxID=2138241 RepID=A0AAF3F3L6_9BILA